MKKLMISLFSIAVIFSAAHHATACPMVSADGGWLSESHAPSALFLKTDIGDLITNFVAAGNTQWRLNQQKTQRWDALFNRIQLKLGKCIPGSDFEASDAGAMALSDSNDPIVFCENDVAVSCVTDDPAAPVPEPATMFLLGTGMLGLFGFGRKKQK